MLKVRAYTWNIENLFKLYMKTNNPHNLSCYKPNIRNYCSCNLYHANGSFMHIFYHFKNLAQMIQLFFHHWWCCFFFALQEVIQLLGSLIYCPNLRTWYMTLQSQWLHIIAKINYMLELKSLLEWDFFEAKQNFTRILNLCENTLVISHALANVVKVLCDKT
jgi:hypothetical protein